MPRQKKTNRSDARYQIVRVVGHAPDGTPKKKSFYGATKADALAKYQEYRLELTRKAEERLHTPFAKWAEEWLETYKRPDVKPSTIAEAKRFGFTSALDTKNDKILDS